MINRIKITILICIGVSALLGAYMHMDSYYGYKQNVETLKKDKEALAKTVDELAKSNNDKSGLIQNMKEQAALDEQRLMDYGQKNNQLDAAAKAALRSMSAKEKEVAKLRAEFFKANPQLVGDAQAELKFFQMTSKIRIESLNAHYCDLFICK